MTFSLLWWCRNRLWDVYKKQILDCCGNRMLMERTRDFCWFLTNCRRFFPLCFYPVIVEDQRSRQQLALLENDRKERKNGDIVRRKCAGKPFTSTLTHFFVMAFYYLKFHARLVNFQQFKSFVRSLVIYNDGIKSSKKKRDHFVKNQQTSRVKRNQSQCWPQRLDLRQVDLFFDL